jgi:hypothetical protein
MSEGRANVALEAGNRLVRLGDRVVAEATSWTTPQEATTRETRTAHEPEPLDGLGGVLRAAGRESTRRGSTEASCLIQRDGAQSDALSEVTIAHDTHVMPRNRSSARRSATDSSDELDVIERADATTR